jgi:hypothetical protein
VITKVLCGSFAGFDKLITRQLLSGYIEHGGVALYAIVFKDIENPTEGNRTRETRIGGFSGKA